jgi:hypothetical protein
MKSCKDNFICSRCGCSGFYSKEYRMNNCVCMDCIEEIRATRNKLMRKIKMWFYGVPELPS